MTTMFLAYPCNTMAMIGTPYAQLRLQVDNTIRERQHKFRPYRTTSKTQNETYALRTSAFRNESVGNHSQQTFCDQTFRKLVYQRQVHRGQDNHQAEHTNGLPYFSNEYSYPTLNFLLPSNGECVQKNLSSNFAISEPYGQQSLLGKQKRIDNLHPFYRRQLSTMAPSRDGLTRTRDKYRVVYTEKQKTLLEEEYQTNNFLPESRRANLAKETELSERQIKFWFQNRRAKEKREKRTKKSQEVIRKIAITSSKGGEAQEKKPDVTTNKANEVNVLEIQSCKYSAQTSCSSISTVLTNQEQTRETQKGDKFSLPLIGEYRLFNQQLGNQPNSPKTGSCMFENASDYSTKSSPSPFGCQLHYPVSPSEWISANQNNTYFTNRVELSPLYNRMCDRIDYRV